MESIIDSKNHNVKSNQSQKLVLISSFCDNEEKKQVLYKNLLELKKIGVDTLVISPNFIQLPSYIIELCDYFFYTKENPLLSPPVRGYYHWKEYLHPVKKHNQILYLHELHNDYGWAALWQTKKLLQIGLTLDYDNFYHLVYDTKVDEVVKEGILGNEINLVYKTRNRNFGGVWDTTLLFFTLDRETASKVEKEITLKEYLRTNGVAEGEVQKWMDKFNLTSSDKFVEDEIFFFGEHDFHNYSPFKDFKMFISKCRDVNNLSTVNYGYEALEGIAEDDSNWGILPANLRIVFHKIKKPFEITIIINGVKYFETPKEYEYIEYPINTNEVKSLKLEYKGEVINFTEKYNSIIENEIYYKIDKRKPIK